MNFFVTGKRKANKKKISRTFLATVLLLVSSCAHHKKKQTQLNQQDETANGAVAVAKSNRLTGISVWLDGGGVRGIFGAGVLKAILQAGIKINSVYSNETGSIAAAVVAGSKSYHLVEWNLKKLSLNEVYGESKSVFQGILKKKEPASQLKENLEKLFQSTRAEELKFPVRFWIDGLWSQEGMVSELVSRAMADRNPFRAPDEWASDQSQSLPVFVSTGGGSIAGLESRPIVVIKADLPDLKDNDYANINYVFFQGRKAGEQRISDIKNALKKKNDD